MGLNWRLVLLVVASLTLTLYENRLTNPSCEIVNARSSDEAAHHPQDLSAMIVSDMLLLGSDSAFLDTYFRDYYLSKFFTSSFTTLKPDILIVLGDLSAKGFQLSKPKWVSVLDQFNGVLGPFMQIPVHVGLGDRDVGICSNLKPGSVSWLSSRFPELDSSGCATFEFGNISFVSLNAVALLCGDNDLRFSIESVMERQRAYLRMTAGGGGVEKQELDRVRSLGKEVRLKGASSFDTTLGRPPGSVLLLHFPLHHQTSKRICRRHTSFRTAFASAFQSWSVLQRHRARADTGPYGPMHAIPPNASQYVLQTLRPRMVFSAHSQEFCDHSHADGTREVTVPAFTWADGNNPAFVMATFRPGEDQAITVKRCSLPGESHVLLISCISVFVSVILATFLTRTQ